MSTASKERTIARCSGKRKTPRTHMKASRRRVTMHSRICVTTRSISRGANPHSLRAAELTLRGAATSSSVTLHRAKPDGHRHNAAALQRGQAMQPTI
eukprot:6248487-Pyramimonas_sp.AAC.4